jgi:hypothetical protein
MDNKEISPIIQKDQTEILGRSLPVKIEKDMQQIEKMSHDILKQMYKEAEPSVDFDFLLKLYEGKPEHEWTKQYVLRESRQMGIIVTHFKYDKPRNRKIKRSVIQVVSLLAPATKQIEVVSGGGIIK